LEGVETDAKVFSETRMASIAKPVKEKQERRHQRHRPFSFTFFGGATFRYQLMDLGADRHDPSSTALQPQIP